MKIFKFMTLALAAMLGFSSCSEDCDHDFVEVDYSNALVGTWASWENTLAEAMVIKEDGSFTITGITAGGALHEDKGALTVVNNKIALTFESSGETLEGRLELVQGETLSIVLNDKYDIRATYYYCKEDLSDEVIGMWVCNDGVAGMSIQTYQEDGKCIYTGFSLGANDYMANVESTYEVVGDMMFQKTGDRYFATHLKYTPNGTAYGDILSTTASILVNDEYVTSTYSFVRVKENLNLSDKVYDYNTAYVTNVKGKDEDFSIVGNTFNIAKMSASNFDMMFRSVLSCLEFPNATTIKQHFLTNGVESGFDTPITVEGNKVTLDMSAGNPAYRKVEMYMFQDADDSQLHIYMPTASFINYFANLELVTLLVDGKIDLNDATAVAKVFADMEARIESVNVSLVYKARK